METKNNLISKTRLISQKIASPEFKTPSKIVHWMCAMQPQDYAMAKWAIGVRLKEPTIVVNGQVAGLWKITIQKNKIIVSVSYFKPPEESTIRKIAIKVRDFGSVNLRVPLW